MPDRGDCCYLSPSEKEFISNGIDSNIRIDGRQRFERRRLQVVTNILPQASGSSTVLISNTSVLVGIHARIDQPDFKTPNQGQLIVSVDR